MSAKVEIYGTSFCRHCVAAREVLDRKGVDYVDYLLDLMPLERNRMIERCGVKKVPQVFIDNVHIGGDEELLMLDASGELDSLLGL